MTAQAETQDRIRFMPHHDHRIEAYHAVTGRYLTAVRSVRHPRGSVYEHGLNEV